MLNAVAIIPARYNSSRFPGKPLALIQDRPLIEWVYSSAGKSGVFKRIIIATDDERIMEAAAGFGAEACLTSAEHRSGTDRIAEAASSLGLRDDSIVVNIQGDTPLIAPAGVRNLVGAFKKESGLKMATLFCRSRDSKAFSDSNTVKMVIDRRGYALYFSRAPIPSTRGGDMEKGFYKHVGIYAFRKDFLLEFARMEPGELEAGENLEQLRALENGYRIKAVESEEDPPEVNVPGDIEKVLKCI